MCSARVQTQFGKNDKWTHLKLKKKKKRRRGKLVTTATVDVRVFYFHFFCGKCSKMKKEKKWGKRRPKKTFSKTIFRTRPLSKWKIKKRTRGKLVTAAAIDVRVFFFPFLLREVLENEKRKKWEKGAQDFFSKTIFRTRPLSKWKIKKQTRGKLGTAANNDVRVFFVHFFCEKCSKMKNEKMGKKAQQTNKFQKRFSKRGHSRNGK
jgi:hypothetical protein